jgi:ribosomal protein L32
VTKKYRVLFLGLVGNEEDFKARMSKLGASMPTVDLMISKAPIILKGGMTLKEARLYADAVQFAGGKVNIQEQGLFEEPEIMNRSLHIKPLEDFIMCPECGYKQLRERACVKCGHLFDKETTGQA